MKTFESQLLELLREYQDDCSNNLKTLKKGNGDLFEQETSFKGFYQWLSKRVEKEKEFAKITTKTECGHRVDLSQFTQYRERCYSLCQDCGKVFEVDMVEFLKNAL